jgi:hypothetical protein
MTKSQSTMQMKIKSLGTKIKMKMKKLTQTNVTTINKNEKNCDLETKVSTENSTTDIDDRNFEVIDESDVEYLAQAITQVSSKETFLAKQ